MDELRLAVPGEEYRAAILDYRAEHFDAGERELHGGALLGEMDFDDWLAQVRRNARPETVRPDWVVSSTYLVLRASDGRMVGMADLRHTLNRFLRAFGGHIGYGVRPSERRKGYGGQILALILAEARKLGLSRVMLACYRDNEGSRQTIRKGGGALERTFVHTDGRTVEVYWIGLDAS